MDISSITSELAQETGYSEAQLNDMLGDKMQYYQQLANQAEQIGAAAEMGLELKEEDKLYLAAVGCSLGNINVGNKLRELALNDNEKYNEIAIGLVSGDEEGFISALKLLSNETETSIRKEFAKLEQSGLAQFVTNLNQLVILEDEKLSEIDNEATAAGGMHNLCTVVGKITEIDEKSLAKTVKGIQIYV